MVVFRVFFLSLVFSISLLPSYTFSEKTSVALYQLAGDGVEVSLTNVIANRISSELINLGVYKVIDRTEMNKALQPRGLQSGGSCDDAICLAKIGKILEVERIISGSITKIGTLYTINLRVLNVSTSEIIYTVNADCEGSISTLLGTTSQNLAQKLVLGKATSLPLQSVTSGSTSTQSPTNNTKPQQTNNSNQDILTSTEASQVASTAEAGKYERKAVSFVDAIYLMGSAVKSINEEQASYTISKIKEKLTLSRFDYNPLPDVLIDDFVNQANSMPDLSLENLTKLMDTTLVPKILKIVDMQKELRAQSYTTEAQRNSFYATKAKEYGFTAVELAKIMNSSFIYFPVMQSYSFTDSDGKCKAIAKVGIVWYRIVVRNGSAKAKLVVSKMTTSLAMAKNNKTYHTLEGPQDAATFCFHSLVKNAARNLLVATQEMPEFRLSGQVIDKDEGVVGFNLGQKEGILVDDKYNITEFEEKEDGSIVQNNHGWIRVTDVADTSSKSGYKSLGKIVAGEPMVGVVISEFPRIPIDVAFKVRTFAPVTELGDKVLSLGMGGQVDARYNVGRYIHISQLYLGVGYGVGIGNKSSRMLDIKSVSIQNLDILAQKRFQVGRVSLAIDVGMISQAISISQTDVFFPTIDYQGIGGFGGFSFGIALSPSFVLELGGRWESVIADDKLKVFAPLESKGFAAHLCLNWSPPALPFDPVDMVRGLAGF